MNPKISAFRQKVYAALKKIPVGKVTTYKDLAQAIGCESCQAVGGALRHNPFAPASPLPQGNRFRPQPRRILWQTRGKRTFKTTPAQNYSFNIHFFDTLLNKIMLDFKFNYTILVVCACEKI